MQTSFFPKSLLALVFITLLAGCGATDIISTPVENIDTVPIKVTDLEGDAEKTWLHADLITDTVPGMSVDRAYRDIIGNRKGKTVIVAVLDAGIDVDHEDLDDVMWVNKDERPGNNKDDDNNGYVDDIHGYNFLGESYNEQLEAARILRLKLGDAALQARAKEKIDKDYNEALQGKQQYEQILQAVRESDDAVKKYLGKTEYTEEDVRGIETQDEGLQRHRAILLQMFSFEDSIPKVLEQVNEGIKYYSDQLNYNLNVEFNGREVVGDNPYDFNDRNYGNGDPSPRADDEAHGTHVAGIIAAERNNGKGVNGVANNVEIMSIRAVPNGDEYDKDIALGIRYAVDNGAKIINGSFGKYFSPNAEWVYDAIRYAAQNDVLLVFGSGNESLNLDEAGNTSYPNDHGEDGTEFVDNVLEVGSLTSTYGSDMVSSFSNYGKKNVDVFAPGSDIYSTLPGGEYDFRSGTSMASPAVAGVAALIRSYYPKLTAPQVKKIIMESGLPSKSAVVLGGDPANNKPFGEISKSGKMVNAYNALILADKVAKGRVQL